MTTTLFTNYTTKNIGPAAVPVITPDATAGAQTTLTGMTCANVTSTNVTVSVFITRGGQDYYIVKEATVPVGGSLTVAGWDQKIALNAGDVVKAVSSAISGIDVVAAALVVDGSAGTGGGVIVYTPPSLAVYSWETGNTQESGTITPTFNGTLTRSTNFAKSGSYSAQGSTIFSYTLPATVASYATSGGFTMEAFIYLAGSPASYWSWMGVQGPASTDWIHAGAYQAGSGMFFDGTSGSGGGTGLTWPGTGQWVHVFLTWYNNFFWAGVNGVYFPQTSSGSYKRNITLYPNINQVFVGATSKSPYGGATQANAYWDQFRISNKNPYVANPLVEANGTYTVPTTLPLV